jgi:hypothetical protein
MSTFVRFNTDDFVLSSDKVFINTWSDDTNQLTSSAMFAAAQSFSPVSASDQKAFRVEVYKEDISAQTAPSASVQFSVAYGHRHGSGSLNFNSSVNGFSASRVVYNQYRQLVYGDEEKYFEFGGTNYVPNDIIVINIDRARYKQRLRPNTLELTLRSGSNIVTLLSVDNNLTATDTNPSVTQTEAGRQFNIVSGSSTTISGSSLIQTNSGSYGYFYPDSGFIVLNVGALRADSFNAGGLFTQPSNETGSLENAFNIVKSGSNFILDSEETISSRYVYTRLKNSDFNYSSNPSYLDPSGSLRFNSFGQNPTTYLTTIGMYNDNNELVAVAKLSKPLKKNFTKEYLLTVKLDF